MAVAADTDLAVHLADTTFLDTAEGSLGNAVGHRDVVHADAARGHPLGDPFALLEVRRPDVSGEAVVGVVRELDRLLLVPHLLDRHDRPERLPAHQIHLVVGIDHHGRREEEAR